jgi:trigger factor
LKKKLSVLLLVLGLTAISGCGKTDSNGLISTGNEPLKDAVYTNDNISLAAYTGLSAEKKIYTITDEALTAAVNEALQEYAEYPSVSRASQTGDWIYADFTATLNGETEYDEEDYFFIIGEKEFGEAFDEKLTGVRTGDELAFSISYDDDYEDETWAGQTVDFTVNVTDVEEEVLPDCTDTFVQENLGYDNYDAFVEGTRASLEETYESESLSDLKDDLLGQVIDASVILQYTQEEYDNAYAEVESFYSSYADMFGVELDEIYDTFEIDDEALKSDTMDMLARNLVIAAIQENENLTLSDEDYEDGIAYYMAENDYTDRDEFLSDYGEDAIRSQLLEDAVLDLLVEKAQITEVEADYEE